MGVRIKIMKYVNMVDGKRMTVAQNGKLLEKVECSKYFGSMLLLMEEETEKRSL